jgi:hypothetical protein
MKIRVIVILIALTWCARAAAQTNAPANDTSARAKNALLDQYPESYTISIIQLIANPEKYDGKRVRFIGYLILEFEGDAIYLHKEDYENSIVKNGLWVDVDRANNWGTYNKKYVIIDAVFDAGNKGHMGMWSGGLKDIRSIGPWVSNLAAPKPVSLPRKSAKRH